MKDNQHIADPVGPVVNLGTPHEKVKTTAHSVQMDKQAYGDRYKTCFAHLAINHMESTEHQAKTCISAIL